MLLCSSSLRTKEIISETILCLLGCHLFVCSEDFSVTLWSLLCVFKLYAPNHKQKLVEGRVWVYMNGWDRINCDIRCILGTHKGPWIRASHSLVPLGIHSTHSRPWFCVQDHPKDCLGWERSQRHEVVVSV